MRRIENMKKTFDEILARINENHEMNEKHEMTEMIHERNAAVELEYQIYISNHKSGYGEYWIRKKLAQETCDYLEANGYVFVRESMDLFSKVGGSIIPGLDEGCIEVCMGGRKTNHLAQPTRVYKHMEG
jgi:hypothetical protein